MKLVAKYAPFLISALALAPTAFAANRTVVAKTSLADEACVLLDADSLHANPEIDYFSSECPGLAGFRVRHDGGDLRSWLTLSRAGVKSELRTSPAGFAYVSSTEIQWAFSVENDKTSKPIGVLFQVSGQDQNDDSANPKDITFNIVASIKGNQACIVSVEKDDGTAASTAKAQATLQKADTLKCQKD